MTNLTDLNKRGINGVAFDPPRLSVELEAFGEVDAAKLLLTMSADAHAKISELAWHKMVYESLTSDKAISLAAVEVFEGKPRELRRKRRLYPKR